MNIRQIEIFRAVMTTGGITAGADFLNISQPAVSRFISDLEHSTGLKLFERRGRRIYPTPEAHAFFEEVKHVFSGLSQLQQAAHNIANFSTGHLRIASLLSLGISFLPRVIKEFLAIYPEITVSLQVHNTATVSSWAERQQFDIGLIGGPVSFTGIDAIPIIDVASVCIMPKGHPLAKKTKIVPKDLEGQEFVSLARDDITRGNIDRVFEDSGIQRIMNIETQYAITICNFVQQGLGVSILSPFSVMDFKDQGIEIRRFEPSLPVQYAMVLPTHRPQSSIAIKFIEILNQYRDDELKRIEQFLN